jgi:GTPase SAR1 family protein
VFVSPLVGARSKIAKAFCPTQADRHPNGNTKFPRIRECIVDGEPVMIELIDTLGPGDVDHYFEKNLMNAYIEQGDGFLFIYSAENRKSLELAKENYGWVVRRKQHERDNATNPIPGILVAVRVEDEYKATWMEVTWEEGNKLAEEMNLAFIQVSLKNGRNVEEVFIHIARLIKKYQERKKRISCMHWAYYDQKILDDRYDKVQGRNEYKQVTTAREREVLGKVHFDTEFEKEQQTGCCAGCIIT